MAGSRPQPRRAVFTLNTSSRAAAERINYRAVQLHGTAQISRPGHLLNNREDEGLGHKMALDYKRRPAHYGFLRRHKRCKTKENERFYQRTP